MMKESNNLTTARILNLVADTVTDEDKAGWRDVYKLMKLWDMSDNKHAMYTGQAVVVAKKILKNGGTSYDMWFILNYIWICINAKKYKLDIRKAANDFKIDYLNNKYRDHSDEEPEAGEPEEEA